jgi:membrane protein YqaA with SNARE-associated domain
LAESELEVEGIEAGGQISARRRNWLRRLYDWTLHWSKTPYASWALFWLAFAESSFFPIPPDVLLIAMAMALPTRAFRYAAICTVGSVLGGVFGYGIGAGFFDLLGAPLIRFYDAEEAFRRLSEGFQAQGFLYVFIAALTPIPYKVFTIAAGVCRIGVPALVVASIAGRGLRFFGLALLFRVFGAPIKKFVDKYFNLITIAFVVLLIAGFAAVKLWSRSHGEPAPEPALEQPVEEPAHAEP